MSMEGSNRSAYIGINVKPAVKRALQVEAVKQGAEMSVSLLASDIIEEHLRTLGYHTDMQIIGEEDQPLPFDEVRRAEIPVTANWVSPDPNKPLAPGD